MRKTTFLILLFMASVFTHADNTGSTSGTLTGTGVTIYPKPPQPSAPGRPKAPSAQVVEASYEDGYLYLSFKYSEGPAVLYVYDADQTTLRSQQVFSTDSEATVYIGSVTDSYLLIETANGHEYEGWIY